MNRSPNAQPGLLPQEGALQHERSPRPLPLFLELVRQVSESDPDLARDALTGLRAYENATRGARPEPTPEIARVGGSRIRDHGGEGPPAILIPSLINPPTILDTEPHGARAH